MKDEQIVKATHELVLGVRLQGLGCRIKTFPQISAISSRLRDYNRFYLRASVSLWRLLCVICGQTRGQEKRRKNVTDLTCQSASCNLPPRPEPGMRFDALLFCTVAQG